MFFVKPNGGYRGCPSVGQSRRLEFVRTPVAGCPLTGHSPPYPPRAGEEGLRPEGD